MLPYGFPSNYSSEIVNCQRWYNKYVKVERGVSLSNRYDSEQLRRMLVVCWQKPEGDHMKRWFSAFETHASFFTWMSTIPKYEWSFFEYILPEQRQKLYFDIDISVAEFKTIFPGKDVKLYSKQLIESLIEKVELFFGERGRQIDREKNLLLFSSSSEAKKSFHLVVDGWFVDDNLQNGKMGNAIRDMLEPHQQQFIDKGVWKRGQQFRMYGSQKAGSGRVKALERQLYGSRKRESKEVFLRSCITYIEGCDQLKISVEQLPWDTETFSNDFIDEEILAEIKKQCKNKNNLFYIFDYRGVDKNRIDLMRVRRARCSFCDRIHDSDNAFMIVNQVGKVYYHCHGTKRHLDEQKRQEVADVSELLDFEVEGLPIKKTEFIHSLFPTVREERKISFDSSPPDIRTPFQTMRQLGGE